MSVLPRVLDVVADRAVVPGYTKLGFLLRQRFWDPLPPDALRGKRVLITGANSGLGKAAATGMARLGAEVHLVVRSAERGEQAKTDILAEVPGAPVEVDRCDVSDLDDVRRFAATVTEVDVLVHNAGTMPPERTETAQGNEVTLATHVLGPHLLTELLTPALRAGEPGRVIFVSSGGMYSQPLRVDDPQYREGEYNGTKAYARTKRMQVVLARLWGRRLECDGIAVHSTHPGWAATPGVTDSLPGFAKVMGPLLRDAEQGADTVVWLAAAEEGGRAETTGQFWHDRAPRPAHYLRRTRETAAQREALWQFCEERTRR
ncbi:SDR family NAD(P)-dependent oxidoreductase [Amycolatopsis sp. 195334CR]|uniref:SDR family NAD(P)-dependent oxidoreductase n=1 Tax=Amycolatopsis sp. 195334CR TaxID=2814588 RepID=UPI001A8D2502|nr:SDR family NAD(P)-dependent oxidoreductase [Amycolatopsis sp. 195334CR]MBN6035396.1 SDR family NAD(P)-dependent oxidoreductase [Amycolatopsis sp. 195334CR]